VSHLREAIDAFASASRLLSSPRLPQPGASALLLQSLDAPEPRAERPAQLEKLRRHLDEIYSTTGREADRRELRDAPWLLWDGTPRLAGRPRLLGAVHSQAAWHQRTLRNLIEAWLAGFDPAETTIQESGLHMAMAVMSSMDRRLELWRQAHRRLALFDATKGPGAVAQWLLSGPEDVAQVLRATGLDDPVRGGGGYTKSVQGQLVLAADVAIRSRGSERAVARAASFLEADRALRFPELRGEMARGLTKPWRPDRTATAPEPAREAVCDFLLRHFKDPRTNPGNWQIVGEDTTSLVRRWLVRASLDMFFGLIGQFALDQHWQWRGAFWKACMDRCNSTGVPFDAWVALGPAIRHMANASSELRGMYGRLSGGVQGNHAVLLMRVGSITICDWSHNGALRAWPSDWKQAPSLYRSDYVRSDLVAKCLPFPSNRTYGSRGSTDGDGLGHHGSATSRWQGSAAELLATRAGIRLTDKDWRPR
jgi:EH_Signature domain